MATKAPGLDWPTLLEAAQLKDTPVLIIWHPQAVTGLSALVANEPLDAWKDWLAFHTIEQAASFLPKAFVEQSEGGRIINISSLAGRIAQPQYGGYTPAKFAVIGLTQMLALELAPHNVTVNAICPGSTDTDMMDGTFRRTGERMAVPFEMIKQGVRRFIPLGRQAEPAEIAAVVAYLASPSAAYITGQAISVDGGIGMR